MKIARTTGKSVLSALIFVVLLAISAFPALSQTAPPHSPTSTFFGPEVFNYEAKLSKIIRGISVADLTFSVSKLQNGDEILVQVVAKNKGTLLKLFRFTFTQQYKSTIEMEPFRVLKTQKHDVQKERVRDSVADFDYSEKRVTFVETDPKEPMRPPRKIASTIEETTHDIVSGIYALRLLPLAVGQTFTLSVSDSGLVYQIPIKVTAREEQKTALGKVMCFRIEPDVFGPERIMEKEGSMIIWVTDDARRIPVRSQINSPIGKIEIKLKSAVTRK